MARRPPGDARQNDFFGAPAPDAKPAARSSKARPPPAGEPPEPEPPEPPEPIEAQIAALSGMELRALAASLTDDALAQLTLAAIRQLRRRLERAARRPGGRATVLERAAQQLMEELAQPGEEDGF